MTAIDWVWVAVWCVLAVLGVDSLRRGKLGIALLFGVLGLLVSVLKIMQ